MLRLLLTPLRWLLRFLFYGCIVIAVMLIAAPFALDLPAHADRVLASLNDGQLRGVQIRALPAGAGGLPPELEIRNLQITNATGGSAQVAMVAARARVGLNAWESLSRGKPVMVVMVENPVIYADAPLDLGAISTAITQTTGVTTQIQLVGGEVINPATSTTVALGDNVVRVDGRAADRLVAVDNDDTQGGPLAGTRNDGDTDKTGMIISRDAERSDSTILSAPLRQGGASVGDRLLQEQGAVAGIAPTMEAGAVAGSRRSQEQGVIAGVRRSQDEEVVAGIARPPEEGAVAGSRRSQEQGVIAGVRRSQDEGAVAGIARPPEEGAVAGSRRSQEQGVIAGVRRSQDEDAVAGIARPPEEGVVAGSRRSQAENAVADGATSAGRAIVPGASPLPRAVDGTPGAATPGICTCPCGF